MGICRSCRPMYASLLRQPPSTTFYAKAAHGFLSDQMLAKQIICGTKCLLIALSAMQRMILSHRASELRFNVGYVQCRQAGTIAHDVHLC